jgi:hypothetical protein
MVVTNITEISTDTIGIMTAAGPRKKGATIENPYWQNPTGASTLRTGSFYATSNNHVGGVLIGGTQTGTASQYNDTTQGLGWNFASGAVSGNNAGLTWADSRFRREWGNYMIGRFLFSSTSDIRVFIGWSSSATGIAGEDPLNALSGCGVGKKAADTNWQIVKNDGTGATVFVDTGIAFAITAVTIQVELDSTSFRSVIGTTTNTAQTTEMPAATTMLTPHFEIETGTGAADKTITILPIWARVGS